MRVHEIATKHVFSVRPDDLIDSAIVLMEEHEFHHLPVISGGRVVGIVSDRDILLGVGWKYSSQRRLSSHGSEIAGPKRIEQIMSAPVIAASSSDAVSTAARLMVEHKISALPIIRRDCLVGLLTETDILRALLNGVIDCALYPDFLLDAVSEHMHACVITTKARAPLADVVRIFREKRIRHLPVTVTGMDGEEIIIGIVSDRDVRRALGDAAIRDDQAQQRGRLYLGPNTVMDVMRTGVRTIGRDETIRDAVSQMLKHQIHSLPVLADQALVGIITETDIVRPLGVMERV